MRISIGGERVTRQRTKLTNSLEKQLYGSDAATTRADGTLLSADANHRPPSAVRICTLQSPRADTLLGWSFFQALISQLCITPRINHGFRSFSTVQIYEIFYIHLLSYIILVILHFRQ